MLLKNRVGIVVGALTTLVGTVSAYSITGSVVWAAVGMALSVTSFSIGWFVTYFLVDKIDMLDRLATIVKSNSCGNCGKDLNCDE